MEKSTAIIDAQTSLLRELRETYIALHGTESPGESAAAILHSIEKLTLATASLVVQQLADRRRIATQQMKPPPAEICKVTHDVVRIRDERNGRHGWENHAAAVIGISPKRVIEIWDAAVAKMETVKPKLAIGQTWRTRSGEVGVIENKSISRFFCRFGPDRVRSYDADGDYGPVPSEFDLTELVSDDD